MVTRRRTVPFRRDKNIMVMTEAGEGCLRNKEEADEVLLCKDHQPQMVPEADMTQEVVGKVEAIQMVVLLDEEGVDLVLRIDLPRLILAVSV